MIHPAVPAALLLALTACAGGPAPDDIGAHPLRYDVPAENPATYAFTASTEFSIGAGPIGTMRVASEQAGVAELTFRVDTAGLASAIRIVEFSGRFENPNQGGVEVDGSDIDGGWTVRVDDRGRVDVVGAPDLSPAARDIAGPESLVRPFFALLPGRASEPGAVWIDTVSTTERTGDTTARWRSVVRSTLTGDTVVGERWLLVIHTESATTMEREGSSGGVEVIQRLAGTTRGTILWDPVAALLVARTEGGRLEGTLALPATGFSGLPVSGTVRRSVTLLP